MGVEQQRRAQHPGRGPDARHRADGRPHRSQVARGHDLHRRRRAVDYRAGLHERREDDRLRARRRRQPPGRVAESRATAGRHRSGGVRRAGRRRRAEAARRRQRHRCRRRAASAWPGCRAGRSGASISRPTEAPARLVNARGSASGLVVVAGRIDARVHERPRHAQLHRRVHARVERAALHRSVARSRRQRGVVAGRIDASRGFARARRRGRGCSRRAAKSTNRGRCASPT